MIVLPLRGRLIALLFAVVGPCAAQVLDPAAYALHDPVVSGDTVHVFTSAIPASGSNYDLRYNRSVDSGKTWLATPVVIANNVNFHSAAAEGANVVVSLDTSGGPRLLRSIDGGSSWLPLLPTHPQNPGQLPAHVAMFQGVLIAVWSEPRAGPGEIYANRSLDLGVTWNPTDHRLDLGLPSVPRGVRTMLGDALAVYVVFEDIIGPNNTTYLNKTLDLGANWAAAPGVVAVGSQIPVAASGSIVLAFVGGQVRRSVDYGVTWAATPILGYSAVVAISGSRAVAVTQPSAWTRFVPSFSMDAGATWLAGGPLIGTTNMYGARLSIQGDTACVGVTSFPACCFSTINSYWVSTNGGAAWQNWTGHSGNGFGGDLRVGTALQNGLFLAYSQQNSTSPVFGLVHHGFHPYGPATPGTGAIAPTLERTGTPSPGHTVGLTLANARGASPALIGAGFSGPAALTIGNATILLALPVVSTWLFTNGSAGTPGSGSATLPFAIPASSIFAGLHVNLQGFVLDAASAVGFSATSGLEMLIR